MSLARVTAVVAAALLALTVPGVTETAAKVLPANTSPPSTVMVPPQYLEIYDPSLGVTWLADGDLAATETFGVHGINADGSMTYGTALKWVNAMDKANHRKGYLNDKHWTLPVTPTPSTDTSCGSDNKKGGGYFGYGCAASPLASLYNTFGLYWPDSVVAVPDVKTGPFHDFQPYIYWSSTPAKGPYQGFETLSFNTGRPMSNISQHFMYVLPVLEGDPFASAARSGLVPVDSGQAVYQPGAGQNRQGLTWLADADLAKSQTFNVDVTIAPDGSMAESTATEFWLPAMNRHRWLGKTGWLLPTRPELQALYKALHLSAQHPVVPVPPSRLDDFGYVQPYLYWSCAGPSVVGKCSGILNAGQQWSFSFGNGFLGTDVMQNYLYVMVYFPGSPPS